MRRKSTKNSYRSNWTSAVGLQRSQWSSLTSRLDRKVKRRTWMIWLLENTSKEWHPRWGTSARSARGRGFITRLKCITRMANCRSPWCHSRRMSTREMAANLLYKDNKWCSRAEALRRNNNKNRIWMSPKEVTQISLELRQWTRSRFTLNAKSAIASAVDSLYHLSSTSIHVHASSSSSSTTTNSASSQVCSPVTTANILSATLLSFSKWHSARSSSDIPRSTLTPFKSSTQRNSLRTTHSQGLWSRGRTSCSWV